MLTGKKTGLNWSTLVDTTNRRQGWMFWICALCLLFLTSTASTYAQQTTGTMVGNVSNPNGAVVPGATVKAVNVDTGLTRSVTSNGQGAYRIQYLPVGKYSLEVTAQGYKLFVQKNVVLTVDQTQRVDAKLDLGAQDETVTVTGAPTLVNTNTVEIGRTVQSEEILGLPLVNRNVYTELTLTPGVQYSSSAGAGGASGNFTLGLPSQVTIINGGIDTGTASVSYYLDGGINMTGLRNYGNPLPNPDALQEFRVETNNYSAEYGRFSAGVVTALTRSGTNQFHGALFEFVRNTALNATPWNGGGSSPYHRNQFGGTVGGPILRNRTFFFFSYAGLRQTTSASLVGAIVPTALERTGNFSQSDIKPVDPTTGNVYNYNGVPGWIPPGDLDPTAQKIIDKYIPLPNTPGNQWKGYIPQPYDNNEYLGKLDHQLSQNNHLTVSYFTVHTTNTFQPGGNLPWSTQTDFARQQNVNISDTQILGASLINQTWLTYTRIFGGRQNNPAISLGSLGSDFTVQGAPSLPRINVNGYFSLGQSIQGPDAGTNFYSVRDVVSKTSGGQSLSFGAEMSLEKDIHVTDLNNFGTFSFSTSAPDSTTNTLADFVTGRPASMGQDSPAEGFINSWYYGFFVQDNVRLTPRLTLNAGLRYDFQTPPTDPQNKISTFVPGTQSKVVPLAPLGVLFPGDAGVTRGIVKTQWHHVSPRVGLAFDPFGNGKTALRAAAGVFYGGISGNQWDQSSNGAPFASRQVYSSIASLTHPYDDPASFPNGNPFPFHYNPAKPFFPPAAAVYGVSRGFRWPYSYQFNAAVQQQLPGNASLTIAYVGAFAHDIPLQIDENYAQYAPGADSSQASLNSRRPYDPGVLGPITIQNSNQTTSYNALQVSYNKRLSHSFTLDGFYVWSNSFWSAPPGAANDSSNLPQDFNHLREERGPADQDQRSMASISGIWHLDYYKGSNRLVENLLNGWTISPIISLSSGLPINLNTGSDNNADGYDSDRPNLVPGVQPYLSPHRSRTAVATEWFNIAAFVPNSPGAGIGPYGADGNTPYNYLRGPGYKDIDLGIFRTFRIWKANLEFRAEATNAFNLVSLQAPDQTVEDSTFGQIFSASDPREIQLGLKLTF